MHGPAMFKDLVQQPLGLSVVGSVSTSLTRLAGLESSSDPDAKAVCTMLRSRGLTSGEQLVQPTHRRRSRSRR